MTNTDGKQDIEANPELAPPTTIIINMPGISMEIYGKENIKNLVEAGREVLKHIPDDAETETEDE